MILILPKKVKLGQINWIGKSIGAEVDFKVKDNDLKFTVFTTRCDTLFGATYCVMAPEHKLVDIITTEEQKKKKLMNIKKLVNLKMIWKELNLIKIRLVYLLVLMLLILLMVKKFLFG